MANKAIDGKSVRDAISFHSFRRNRRCTRLFWNLSLWCTSLMRLAAARQPSKIVLRSRLVRLDMLHSTAYVGSR